MVAAFDFIAFIGFGIAVAAALYAAFKLEDPSARYVALFALLATGVMALVSLINLLNDSRLWTSPHNYEEYLEVLFIPLLVYLTYSAQAYSEKVRVMRERAVVARLDSRLAESLTELGEQRLEMLQALTAAVDARDRYTALHSMHVADYACAIAYRMGMRDQLRTFEQAGLLHDIGKIGVPDHLLLRPSALSDAEYRAMQGHVEESARILMTVPFLSEVVPLVRHHHERWDGTGYPDRLAGESIPKGARILAVADAFDAMTTDRPYRRALETAVARSILLEGRGTQFDTEAVDAFVELLDAGIVTVAPNSEAA